MCDVDQEAVVAAVDAPSIYDIPQVLHAEGLDAYVVRRLGLPFRDVDWTAWDGLLRAGAPPGRHRGTIALVGKYVDLPDAYLSVTEALRAGGFGDEQCGADPLGGLRRLRDRGGGRKRLSATSTPSASRAGSGCAGSRASWARSAMRARTTSRHWACAWGCSAWSSSSPATWPRWPMPTRRSSTRTPPTPWWRRWPTRPMWSAANGTWAGTMRLGLYPAKLTPGSVVARGLRRDRTWTSATATATRSTTPTGST